MHSERSLRKSMSFEALRSLFGLASSGVLEGKTCKCSFVLKQIFWAFDQPVAKGNELRFCENISSPALPFLSPSLPLSVSEHIFSCRDKGANLESWTDCAALDALRLYFHIPPGAEQNCTFLCQACQHGNDIASECVMWFVLLRTSERRRKRFSPM